MSYTKDYFYVLTMNENMGRKRGFEIHKFKFTQDRSKPFVKVGSVEVDPEVDEIDCDRITPIKYNPNHKGIDKELVLLSGDKFRIFTSH